MKVLNAVGALGGVGTDEVLAVLAQAGDDCGEETAGFQQGEAQIESSPPPRVRVFHGSSSRFSVTRP